MSPSSLLALRPIQLLRVLANAETIDRLRQCGFRGLELGVVPLIGAQEIVEKVIGYRHHLVAYPDLCGLLDP
jgi:hypothetical protein